jgi:cyanophycin synthetase
MSKKNNVQLLRINHLRGPNIWTYRPALEVWLDLGELEDHPSHRLPGFNERLTTWLPALTEHHCGVGERGGFLQRLQEGTWMGHVLEHIVIELLNLAGMPTGFGQTRSTSQRGVYRMVFRARDEQVARSALAEGHALLMAAINDESFDVSAAVDRVRTQIDDCYLGPSTANIVAAATEHGIPHIRLNEGNLVQLGHGAAQRRIWTAESELTSAIAENISRDKDLTKTLLKACGVPVPEGEIVTTAEQAWEAAEDLGLPVVIKPTDGNHGRGVSLDLSTQADVQAAFELAAKHGSEVLVEHFVPGHEHRLLVVGGQVVAAARGESAWITGDGSSTVLTLIEQQINSDPRRGLNEDCPLNRIDPAEDAVILLDLQRQGLTPESVPAASRRVLIQRNGNVAIDCTDEVHPDVAYQVALAARVVGLDIAGVDVVAQDIGRPLHEQDGAVVEVNAGPGLLMHLKPAEGLPRPVGKAIVDHLFGPQDTGRVPIVGVAGSLASAEIARLTAWLLHLSGRHVGLACQDGLFLGNRKVDGRPSAHFEAGQRLLMNRDVNAVVLENGAAAILDDGLAYDRCQVGIVTDLIGAHGLERHDVFESEQLFKVLRTQVDVVTADGVAVLCADDPVLLDMAGLCDGQVILYSNQADQPDVLNHVQQGGSAVVRQGDQVILLSPQQHLPALDLESATAQRLLLTWQGRHGLTIAQATQCLMAAVAASWAMGVTPELIHAGLETFVTTQQA